MCCLKSCDVNKADFYNTDTVELLRMISRNTQVQFLLKLFEIDKQWITRVFGCKIANLSHNLFCAFLCMFFCFVILRTEGS